MERKGGLFKHGAEDFKPGFAMHALISSLCEVTWKNKGCILPVCRACQEAKAKGFFLTEENQTKVCAWDMVKWGGACQSSPIFHMAVTPAQIRKTYLVFYLYRAESNPRSRLSLQDRWSQLFVLLTTLVCVTWPFLYLYAHCAHICGFLPLGPTSQLRNPS